MLADIYPIQILRLTLSGLVNRHQADVIAYLVEETRDSSRVLDGLGEVRALVHRASVKCRGGLQLALVIHRVENRRHLPIVELKPAA